MYACITGSVSFTQICMLFLKKTLFRREREEEAHMSMSFLRIHTGILIAKGMVSWGGGIHTHTSFSSQVVGWEWDGSGLPTAWHHLHPLNASRLQEEVLRKAGGTCLHEKEKLLHLHGHEKTLHFGRAVTWRDNFLPLARPQNQEMSSASPPVQCVAWQ